MGGKLYVDGQPVGTFDPTSQSGDLTTTEPLRIGRHASSSLSTFFKGRIDESSIYRRALSDDEVRAIYAASSAGKCLRNRPPVAKSFNAGTPKNTSISIPVEKFTVLASDPDGDALAVSAVVTPSAASGAVVLGASAVTYTPAADFVGADQFSFTLSDGKGGTASANVLMDVRPSDGPSANMLPLQPSGNGFLVRFAGIPGRTYTLQRATALSGPWSTVASVTAGDDGLASFTDPNPPPGTAFYRTVYP
jgi:hypothetical protein